MICPKCLAYEYRPFCPTCGSAKQTFIDLRCECGRDLGMYDPYCSQCGRKSPTKPTKDQYDGTLIGLLMDASDKAVMKNLDLHILADKYKDQEF
jgi:hypothetical protein